MTLVELDTLVKHKYIDNPIELAEKLNITDETDVISFLTLVHSYNEKIIGEQAEKIKRAKELESKRAPLHTEQKLILPSKELEVSQTETRDRKVQEILSLLEICSLEEIPSILPSKDDKNFHSIMNQVMVSYYETIVYMNSFILEIKDTNSPEKKEFEEELKQKRKVFDALKKYRGEEKEEEIILDSNTPPILVHLETPTKNSYLYQDIEGLSPELYKHFLRIFEPFVEGKPVFTKYLTNHTYSRVFEVKNKIHQARIYGLHLSGNIYLILGALNKKDDWGKSNQGFVVNRYASWNMQKAEISKQIEDPTFLEKEKEKTQQVLELLRRGR